MNDDLDVYFDGQTPLTARLMNAVIGVFGLGREGGARFRGSSDVASRDLGDGGTLCELGETITATPSQSEQIASRLRGTSTAPPLGAAPHGRTLYPAGQQLIPSAPFTLEVILHPLSSTPTEPVYALGSNSRPDVDDVAGDDAVASPSATYAQSGYQGVPGRRNLPARLWLLYVQGEVTGGTYQVGYGGALTTNLDSGADASALAAALADVPALAGSLVRAAVEGLTLPFLVCPTGEAAALLSSDQALSVVSNLEGDSDLLGRPPAVSCALVSVGRAPGVVFYYLATSPGFGHAHVAGATGGTFVLRWRGHDTPAIPMGLGNATAIAIASALGSLPGVQPTDVFCSAVAGGLLASGASYAGFLEEYGPAPADSQPAIGWRIYLRGALDDLANWLPLRLLGAGLTGGSAPPPDADLSQFMHRWGDASDGEYGEADWGSSSAVPQWSYSRPDTLLALAGCAAPVTTAVPHAAKDYTFTVLVEEYPYPGGYAGTLPAVVIREPFGHASDALGVASTQAMGAFWVDQETSLLSCQGRYAARGPGASLFPRQGESIFGEPAFQTGLAPSAPPGFWRHSARSLEPDAQRPSLEMVRVGQHCVVCASPGQPWAISDGWLVRPRSGDYLADSAYGDGKAYLWLDLRDQMPLTTSHGGGLKEATANLLPVSVFRVGESTTVALRTGRGQPVPQMTALLDLDGGVTLTVHEFFDQFDDSAHLDTVVWADDLTPGGLRDRTVSQYGKGAVGQVLGGRFTTGPSLGMQSSLAQPHTVAGPVVRHWYSGGYVADGYLCSVNAGRAGVSATLPAGELFSPSAHVFDPRWPVRLKLRCTSSHVTQSGQADPCLGAALSSGIDLLSSGIDLSGRVGYADAIELDCNLSLGDDPPPAGTKQAYFGTGLSWHGSVSACGGTVHFLLAVTTAELDSGNQSAGQVSGSYYVAADFHSCRVYVFWNATPPLAMPHHGVTPLAGRAGGLPDRPSFSPWSLPPGLVGVSNLTHVQGPLEGATRRPWQFRMGVGAGGEPPGVRACLDLEVSFESNPGYVYPLIDPDGGADWTGLAFHAESPGTFWADYSGIGGVHPAYYQQRATSILGRCCAIPDCRLSLSDASTGQFGSNNLFSRFRVISSEAQQVRRAHQRGWAVGGVAGYDRALYCAMLVPDATGEGFLITFLRFEPLGCTTQADASVNGKTGFQQGGTCRYVPINSRDPATQVMTGPLVWTGGCASFSLAGVIRLEEAGVGSAIVNVFVTR